MTFEANMRSPHLIRNIFCVYLVTLIVIHKQLDTRTIIAYRSADGIAANEMCIISDFPDGCEACCGDNVCMD